MFDDASSAGDVVVATLKLDRRDRKKIVRPLAPLDRSGDYLELDNRTISRVARRHTGNIAVIAMRQAYYEKVVCGLKKIRFRSDHNSVVRNAYCEMNLEEFDAINARQSWANWRTIPRNLGGRLLNRPGRIIDICCGTGQSTEVLAYYVPAGSEILGLEYNPDFLKLARLRQYRHDNGSTAKIAFHAQSVLDPLCYANGKQIPAGSIDLVNCSGAIGCHFEAASTAQVALQLSRVLKPGGLALIDTGETGTSKAEVLAIFSKLGYQLEGEAKSCALDRYTQVALRKKQ